MKKLLIVLLLPLFVFSQNNTYSMMFDGNSDYIEISNDLEFNSDAFAVMFWINTEWISSSDDLQQHIIDFGKITNDGCGIRLVVKKDQENLYSWIEGLDGTNQIAPINLSTYSSQFVHITIQYYLNGTINTQAAAYVNNNSPQITGGDNNEDFTFYNNQNCDIVNTIGIDNTLNDDYIFEGIIDEVSFWKTQLNSDQIEQYMHCSPTGIEDDLIGFWDFDETITTGVMLYDSSLNNYHGERKCINCDGGGADSGPQYSETIPIQDCINSYQDNETSSTNIIGDLNCDGQTNQLDALILSNLILEIGDSPDELEQQYPCLIENFNGLTTDDIESLQEIVDMMEDQLNINFTAGSGTGVDLAFPDGYAGVGVTFDLLQGDYTVPLDSIFYITNILGEGSDGYYVNINDIIIAEGEMNLNSSPGLFLPIIVNAQETISGNMQIHGMLFEKKEVTGVTSEDGFTVEAGKKFYITNAWSDQYDSGVLEVGGVYILEGQSNYNNSITLPVVVNSGQNISGNMNFNGYLVDEDYFSSAGSSSHSNDLVFYSYIDYIQAQPKENLTILANENDFYQVPEDKTLVINSCHTTTFNSDGVLITDLDDVAVNYEMTSGVLDNIPFKENTVINFNLSDNFIESNGIIWYKASLLNNNSNVIHKNISLTQSTNTYTVPEGSNSYINKIIYPVNGLESGDNNFLVSSLNFEVNSGYLINTFIESGTIISFEGLLNEEEKIIIIISEFYY